MESNTLDLIQTICSVLSLLVSLFVAGKVIKISSTISGDGNSVGNKMTIKNGDGNIQSTGDVQR